MPLKTRKVTLVAAIALASTSPAVWGQSAAGSSSGAQVDHVRISPGRDIVIPRGDSTELRLDFVSGDGFSLTGVHFDLRGSTDHIAVRRISGRTASFMVIGREPATRSYYLLVHSGGDRGGLVLIDSLRITVDDWPVAAIEVESPGYRAYAGTTLRLHSLAITTAGTEHNSARVTWRSETPGLASMTPDGVISLLAPGTAELVASAGEFERRMSIEIDPSPARQVTIAASAGSVRTGDVVAIETQVFDGRGRPVTDIAVALSVAGLDSDAAQVRDGKFVAEEAGVYAVTAVAGELAAHTVIAVTARPPTLPVELIGRGATLDMATTDLWVFEGSDGHDYAYTGTMPANGGQRMYAWDVTDPRDVILVDSVRIDARRVNDVKVNGTADWAIITGEQSSSRRNGIVVLDLAEPAHPRVMAHLTEGMTGGVHNVWINGDVVYAVNDGTAALDIVDMSHPETPVRIGSWELRPGDTDKYLHDVWSDGRYAYLSYWDDGIVVLDVGAGTHGGSPRAPRFVSSYSYPGGHTHVAFREGRYIFVGDEIFGCEECINGPRGYVHVIDASDIEDLREVARYEVPEAGAHNLWVENGLLYVAYYQGGLRIVDVSGELSGDLYRQGREIGWFPTSGLPNRSLTPNQPFAWGPQPFKGNIFVSDLNSGLWVLNQERPERLSQ